MISDTHSTADKMKQPLLPPPSKLIKLKLVALVKPMKHKCSAQENTGKFRGVEQRLPSTREAWDSIQNTGNASGRRGKQTNLHTISRKHTRKECLNSGDHCLSINSRQKQPKNKFTKVGFGRWHSPTVPALRRLRDKVIWATQSDLVERGSRVRSRGEEGTRERILQSCHEHKWKVLLQVICKLNLKNKDIHYYTRPSGDLF